MNRSKAATLFLSNARQGLNRWWRWVLGILLILVIWQGVGTVPLVTACGYLNNSSIRQFTCNNLQISGDSAVPGYLLTNYSFIIGIVGVWITVRLIHRKSLTQVITGRLTFDYNRVIYAIWIGLLLNAVVLILNLLVFHQDMTFKAPNIGEYVTFFLFAVVLTSYQAGFEEVFFRGYLLQGFSLITRNRIFLVAVTTLLFTAVHLLNPEAQEAGYPAYVSSIAIFGIFLAVVSLLDGGIELAIGYHAINNLWIILIANTDVTSIPSPSLFELPTEQVGLFPDVFVQLFIFIVLLAIFNRKYNWFNRRNNT